MIRQISAENKDMLCAMFATSQTYARARARVHRVACANMCVHIFTRVSGPTCACKCAHAPAHVCIGVCVCCQTHSCDGIIFARIRLGIHRCTDSRACLYMSARMCAQAQRLTCRSRGAHTCMFMHIDYSVCADAETHLHIQSISKLPVHGRVAYSTE